ncbi:hypothetical protein ACWEOO_04970 [Kribbella sp. NPDC004138]
MPETARTASWVWPPSTCSADRLRLPTFPGYCQAAPRASYESTRARETETLAEVTDEVVGVRRNHATAGPRLLSGRSGQ